jgi:hypothetical protein
MEGVEMSPGILHVVDGGGQLAEGLDGGVGDTLGPTVLGRGLVGHVPTIAPSRIGHHTATGDSAASS